MEKGWGIVDLRACLGGLLAERSTCGVGAWSYFFFGSDIQLKRSSGFLQMPRTCFFSVAVWCGFGFFRAGAACGAKAGVGLPVG